MPEAEISKYLLDRSPVLAWAKDTHGRYLFVNDTWLNVCHLESRQVLGKTDLELFGPDFAGDYMRNDQEVLCSGETIEFEERAPNEGPLIAHSMKFPMISEDGQIIGVGGIAFDITERHLTKQRLEESERKFQELIEHSPEAFVVLDVAQDRFTDANENAQKFFGLSREELLAASPTRLSPTFQPDGRTSLEATQERIKEALSGGSPVFDWVHQASNGELLPCRIWLAGVNLPSGPGVRASIIDMREIEGMRSSLQNTRAQLDAVQDALPQMVVVYDPVSKDMSHCNRTYDNTHLEEPLWVLAGEACRLCNTQDSAIQEVRARTVTGKELTLEVSVSVFARDPSGHPQSLLLVASDVTEQREKDALLRDTQRLESLGRLAGGVAHDFNNLLTVILGAAELLEDPLAGQNEALRDLDALTGAANQARDLTTQLLTFARSHRESQHRIPLDDKVRESLSLLVRLVGEDIELTTDLAAKDASVSMDRGQLEQVLVNLVLNARDAIGSRGQIRILSKHVSTERMHELSPSALRDFVQLSISDNGAGMDEETLEKAVDPFFTTKGPGKGTGLGLSTVHGIVHNAGGQIQFRSEVGRGTEVIIFLPVSEAGRHRESSARPALPRIQARVLLVEDEDSVRAVNLRGLEKAGHRVVGAPDGKRALELLRKDARFDVVVTDVVMPEMSGFELADKVHALRPELPFIFVSGYAEAALADRGLVRAQVDLLQKPFSPLVLAQHIAFAVNRAQG